MPTISIEPVLSGATTPSALKVARLLADIGFRTFPDSGAMTGRAD
jgi:hypothetical protein